VSEYVDWGSFLGADPNTAFQLPEIAFTPTLLFFGNVAVGQTANVSLTISNMGNASLTVSSAVSDNAQFKVLTTLPLSVAPGAMQTMAVRFSPILSGSHSAALTITSDDPARAIVNVPLLANTGPGAGLRGEFLPIQAQSRRHAQHDWDFR